MFDYSIQGVGSSIQFGKQGLIITNTGSQFSLVGANGSTAVPILVATPTVAGHAVTKSYIDSVVGSTSGTYSPNLSAHYIASATSVINATNLLDTSLYSFTAGAGLASTGVFTANSGAHYIAAATSIVDSTNKLDTALYNANVYVSAINTGVGLSLGTYVAPSSNYLGSTTSVLNALTALDTQIYDINTLNLGSRVSTLETFETSTTNTDNQQNTYISNINTSAGFGSTGTHSSYASTNFILNSDSLSSAISKLDTEAQVLSSSLSSLNTTVTSLNGNFGSVGTYSKVVTDSHGRVVSGSTIASGDVTLALGFTPAVASVSVYDQQITTTSPTTVLTITPTKLNVLVNVFYRVVTASTAVEVTIGYTDNSSTTQSFVLVNTTETTGNYAFSYFVNIKSGTSLTVNVTAGTANQLYVSASAQAQ